MSSRALTSADDGQTGAQGPRSLSQVGLASSRAASSDHTKTHRRRRRRRRCSMSSTTPHYSFLPSSLPFFLSIQTLSCCCGCYGCPCHSYRCWRRVPLPPPPAPHAAWPTDGRQEPSSSPSRQQPARPAATERWQPLPGRRVAPFNSILFASATRRRDARKGKTAAPTPAAVPLPPPRPW